MCVSGGKKCSFFGKFGVLCFLETPVLRFALLRYYRRVTSVMKTASVSKLFLAIFDRTYEGLYICHSLWLQNVSIKSNDQECTYKLPYLKRGLKNPTKNGLSAVRRHLSGMCFYGHPCIVQFSKRYLKTPSQTFIRKLNSKRMHLWLLWNLFKCSIN